MNKFLIVFISMALTACTAIHSLPEPNGKVFPINVTEVHKNATAQQ